MPTPTPSISLAFIYTGSLGALDNPFVGSVTLVDTATATTLPAQAATFLEDTGDFGGLLSATIPGPIPTGISSGDAGQATWKAAIGGVQTTLSVQTLTIELSSPPVPVPPGGTVPGNAAALASYYGLKQGYATGAPLAAVDFDKVVALLDNGLGGALAAIGAGTVGGGAAGAATGLSLPVSAWTGILPSASARLGFAPGNAAAATLIIPASSSFTVYAAPVAGTFTDPAATPYDTAESGAAEFLVVTGATAPDGGLALLTGVSTASAITSTTDVRVLIGAAIEAQVAAMNATIALIEAAVGSRYFAAGPPAAVDSRVTALESAAAGGPTPIVVFWDTLARTGVNAQTIAAYVAAQQAPAQPAPTPLPLVLDIECVNTLKLLGINADLGVKVVAAALMLNADLITSLNTVVDVYFYDPRIHGLDPTRIDTVHTTAPISTTTGMIG